MKWSIRLGRLLGIDVYMHLTFLLLLAWVAVENFVRGRSIAAALAGVGFMLAIFACVLLHELGHALTARHYGIRTRDITLLPIGGLARLERMPDEPLQELWVALAGPAVNVLIAGAAAAWLALTNSFRPFGLLEVAGGPFFQWLAAANLFLALFNLIPAFPMDGGRVLRALLATQLEYTRATQLAATVGQGIALLFGFVGLFFNYPMLLFIALFVWIGAAQESSLAQVRSSLAGIPVSRAMITDFHTLAPEATLAEAVELTLKSAQKDYPVVADGRVVGVLVQGDLITALAERGAAAPVAEVMQRDFQTVDPREMLATALARLRDCACHTLPVYQQERLVGLVTMDNIGEFLSFQDAWRKARGGGGRQEVSALQPGRLPGSGSSPPGGR